MKACTGLDNWKRDYPVKERAVAILKAMVTAVDGHGCGFESGDSGFWPAYQEAKALLSEVDANDA